MSPDHPCRIVLVGMMGSGKTTVGRSLSRRTGWRYHDNDELLAAATHHTAAEVAAAGEAALRRAEAAALDVALAVPEPAIVAAAAGTILDDESRRRMRDGGLVVWLHADPEHLAARAAGATHRPWLDEDAREWFARAAAEREPLYREVADLEVTTVGVTPDQVAEEIAGWLASTMCARWLAEPS
ncbi:MAG TPA: shikimate kinase [candidate division Zixibacteria bacterium]|nr:shikimate kinase [candidate division Zixibacteria bacterium]